MTDVAAETDVDTTGEYPEPETSDVTEEEQTEQAESGGGGDPAEYERSEEREQEAESFAEMERIAKELDSQTKSNATRITNILGERALDYVPCEWCNGWHTPGFRYKGPQPQEVVEAVMHALGERAPGEYLSDTDSTMCTACNGLGAVLTGSKVERHATMPCMECQGNGWVHAGERRRLPQNQTAPPPSPHPTVDTTTGEILTAPSVPDPPEVAQLRAQGYTVMPPMRHQ